MWALDAMDPLLRNSLEQSWTAWRRAVQADPCSYCGNAGGEADHIVPRSSGGRDRWHNITGSCHKCNRAKGGRSLLAFVGGIETEVNQLKARLATFGPLTVAAADMEGVIGGSSTKPWIKAVQDALLERFPDVDGALAYRKRRRRGYRHRRWNHMLATRRGGADAGSVCRALGGGGTASNGAVQAEHPLFKLIDEA